METVSTGGTDAASGSGLTHLDTCSHSTWPPLSGSGSQSFDQSFETNNTSTDITAAATAILLSQRRRINPDTLALRLGPDLVRDLEALIQPGNIEMPSFAIRKELQERYSIDRRHVYDYFHSRGLRVIKEDKSGNAIVPRDPGPALASPKPNLRVRISRQASTKESPQGNTANLVPKRSLKEARPHGSKPCGVMKAKPGRPRNCAARSTHDDPPPPAALCPSSPAVESLIKPVSEMNKHHEFDQVVSSLEECDSFAQAAENIFSTHCGTPMFETSPVLYRSPRVAPDLRGDGAGLGLSPHTSADPWSPNFCTISATEHLALYPPLPGAISTRDIQECTGTYKTYMQERSRLYYEELLAVPYEGSRNGRKPASSCEHQSIPCNYTEFRYWINPGEVYVPDEKAAVSRNKSVKSGANTIRQKTSPVLSYGTDNDAQFLDILFPMLDQNRSSIDDLGESPVVRTQRQPYVPLDFSFLPKADSGDAEDHFLDAAPSSGPRRFPECSVSLQIRGQSIHGHSDFPGSPALLPPAELQHVVVNPKCFTTPLLQSTSSLNAHEMSAFVLKQKSSRNNLATQTRFAPCTPPMSQVCDCDTMRMRSFTSHSARRRTTSAGGGI